MSAISRRELLQYSVLSTPYLAFADRSLIAANDIGREWTTAIAKTGAWTAFASDVKVTEDSLIVELTDGRTIAAPIHWYPRLLHGTPAERNNWEIGSGIGIHWPDLDEDISVENLLRGQPSGESQKSLQRWLDQRKLKTAG